MRPTFVSVLPLHEMKRYAATDNVPEPEVIVRQLNSGDVSKGSDTGLCISFISEDCRDPIQTA
jgi:hypothetical protein